MISFVIILATSIICAILTIVFFIISLIKDKGGKYGIIASIFSGFATLISLISIKIPNPLILPLNNETQIYDNKVGITIYFEESPFFEIYYSTDGIDPKYGNMYLTPINITESTTICARNKFLWWWSDVEKSSYIIDSDDKNDDNNINTNQEIESKIYEQDESVTQIDDLENSSDIDDEEEDDKIEIPNEFESLDNLEDIPIASTESNDVVRDIPSNYIGDTTPSTESVLQPETVSTPETIPIPEQPKQNTENEIVYTITLTDKNGKSLSNKKLLIKCNNNVIAEVYTDLESTFYLSGSVLSQPIDWRTIYELILCKENLYDENGQKISGYPISSFNLTVYDTDFEVLCDAYME